jgi:hypothetical protein
MSSVKITDLGDGISLFGKTSGDIGLDHTNAEVFENGFIQMA